MVGEVALCRPDFYGPHCQQGCAPLDEALQRSERRKPWDMQKAGARLAAEVPFETAQERCAELTGLSLSDHTGHAVGGELSYQLDVLEVRPTAAAMAERVAELAVGQTWRPVVVVASDGAFVPTRPEAAKGAVAGRRHARAKRAGWPGEWQEAKGFRVSLVDRERIVHLLSWYQVCRDEDVGATRRRVQEEIRKLLGFLRNRAERLHDRGARKGGYPIGSGGIEAANKSISHVRLKRSGAWWYLKQANHMLALRCAIYNGTFERVFEAYKRRALQRHGRNPP